MTESAHARYRMRLEELTAGDAVEAGGAGAKRLFERFEPDAEPWATYVFAAERRLVRVEAFTNGPLRVTQIPPDPGLPTLERALDCGGRATVVRYHPGRRCTIRVDDQGRTRFAKVYGNRRGRRLHADALALWQAHRRGELGFRVARPGRFEPELRAVWQEAVPGEPLSERLRARGAEPIARRVGRAAGSLSRSSFRPRAWRERHDELVRTAARCAELERRIPALGEQTRRFLALLESAYATCGSPRPRPVHGAMHPSQWLENGRGLALLDYDSLALGDPELDAATFLADLDTENVERVPVARLGAAFLDGFEGEAGPLDHRLLTAYRAQRRLEKALRVARAIRPDGDHKAARRLRRALECLEARA